VDPARHQALREELIDRAGELAARRMVIEHETEVQA